MRITTTPFSDLLLFNWSPVSCRRQRLCADCEGLSRPSLPEPDPLHRPLPLWQASLFNFSVLGVECLDLPSIMDSIFVFKQISRSGLCCSCYRMKLLLYILIVMDQTIKVAPLSYCPLYPLLAPASERILEALISEVILTWVPPQSLCGKSPILTTRTLSPYFSPRSAIALVFFAPPDSTTSVTTGSAARISLFYSILNFL